MQLKHAPGGIVPSSRSGSESGRQSRVSIFCAVDILVVEALQYLRRKLEGTGVGYDPIRTVHGLGYAFRKPE
jgi:hypothetical protein